MDDAALNDLMPHCPACGHPLELTQEGPLPN